MIAVDKLPSEFGGGSVTTGGSLDDGSSFLGSLDATDMNVEEVRGCEEQERSFCITFCHRSLN